VPRTTRLELHLVTPQKRSDTLGVSVAHPSVGEDLSDGGNLAPLHGFLELFEDFFANQLLGTTLMHSADQKLAQALLSVSDEPPLALAPAVAQGFSCFSKVGTLCRLEEPEHLQPMEQVAVAMALFELLQFLWVFLDYLWVVYLRHDFIVPLKSWVGITRPEPRSPRQSRQARCVQRQAGGKEALHLYQQIIRGVSRSGHTGRDLTGAMYCQVVSRLDGVIDLGVFLNGAEPGCWRKRKTQSLLPATLARRISQTDATRRRTVAPLPHRSAGLRTANV
jgi:hypothetical protein